MKNIKSFKLFNESLKDKLKGKSNKELIKSLEGLNDSDRIRKIIKYKLSYDLLPTKLDTNGVPDNLTVKGNLYCYNNELTSLPDNLIVNSDLYCYNNQLTSLPDDLIVNGDLYCYNNQLTSLPNNLTIWGDLDCRNNQLPKNIIKPVGVKGHLYK